MKTAWPLRKRVSLAFAALGLFLSLCFTVVTALIAEKYEYIVIKELLADAADDFFHPLDPADAIKVYSQDKAPELYRELPIGVHEPGLAGHEGVHVGVYEDAGRRAVIVTDVSEIEVLERNLIATMAVVLVFGTALAGWLGWLLSSMAIRPVTRLAENVMALPVTPQRTRFERDFADDALGAIAHAIDRYQERLFALSESEKSFFIDAGHELRTPITAVKGAIEVMCDDPMVVAAHRKRIERIERAIGELSVLLNGLMLGTRRALEADGKLQLEDLDLAVLVHAAVLRLSPLDPQLHARIRIVHDGSGKASVSKKWVEALLDVLLLRLAIRYASSNWLVRIDAETFSFHQECADRPRIHLESKADLGLSLRFAERICRAIGWSFSVSQGAGGLVVTVCSEALAADQLLALPRLP